MQRSGYLHITSALVVLLLFATACELDQRADSDYQLLRGDWQVARVTADGDGQTSLVNSRFDRGVSFAFGEDGSTGNRFLTMYGNRQDEADLNLRSALVLSTGNGFTLSSPDIGDLFIRYGFDHSNRVVLTANRPYGGVLLSALLGNPGYTDPVVEIVLERADWE